MRLYIVNIEPRIRYPQYQEQRYALERAARLTEGGFYIADDAGALGQVLHEIDQLEGSHIPLPEGANRTVKRRSLRGELALSALICLGLSITLGSTYLRRGW